MDRYQSGAGLFTVIAIAVVFGAVGGAATGYWMGRSTPSPAPGATLTTPPPRPGPAARVEVVTDRDAIVQAVEKVAPAVVKIETLRAPTMSEVFDQLFAGVQPRPVRGVGSGFVFEYKGRKLVMTNNHVVGDAEELHVKMSDGRVFRGELVGAAPNADVAVVDLVNPQGEITPVPLGDSEKLKVGEWVIAIGNPFDFEHTVTVGVVSAKGYRRVEPGKERKVIQTDAAINFGNSGGPLVDLGGNVVGINYAIYSPTGTTAGIGFAIPINEARTLARVLIEGGPWVGLPANAMMVNSPGLQKHFNLPTDKGVVVFYVVPGSPAAKGGLKMGDIILSVDGKPAESSEQVQQLILNHNIGDTITFVVQRGEQQLTLQVIAGKIPEAQGQPGRGA